MSVENKIRVATALSLGLAGAACESKPTQTPKLEPTAAIASLCPLPVGGQVPEAIRYGDSSANTGEVTIGYTQIDGVNTSYAVVDPAGEDPARCYRIIEPQPGTPLESPITIPLVDAQNSPQGAIVFAEPSIEPSMRVMLLDGTEFTVDQARLPSFFQNGVAVAEPINTPTPLPSPTVTSEPLTPTPEAKPTTELDPFQLIEADRLVTENGTQITINTPVGSEFSGRVLIGPNMGQTVESWLRKLGYTIGTNQLQDVYIPTRSNVSAPGREGYLVNWTLNQVDVSKITIEISHQRVCRPLPPEKLLPFIQESRIYVSIGVGTDGGLSIYLCSQSPRMHQEFIEEDFDNYVNNFSQLLNASFKVLQLRQEWGSLAWERLINSDLYNTLSPYGNNFETTVDRIKLDD